ncbi:S-adenosylmethionine:tRNA ribosyltransferase-isomerase [Anaerohalosphaera lusitana]|uniref:S-adenosylmethionine:tRNA ribosyltransferase-isomerase n=1 Tax=Anaerohalosphaera lusitana TaxID=1936003 RepID=A0A1U9NLK6_9BACT|nr:tRNA preQ1(34) S-adenosylmethionine ribosyltransferase-isomerase QueA [Anaerohalosphaera lusitana]AQT68376.1 S-adenosylmethionine:tRNA ribosyltransferase-isomerase [Anaerohalosphaera lusitana]
MLTEQLNFDLPGELIAQKPASVRSKSRLLALKRGTSQVEDRVFEDICEYFQPGDCLVLNNTKVLPARFFGRRTSGATLEGLYLSSTDEGLWEVMLKNARRVKEGEVIVLSSRDKGDFCEAVCRQRLGGGRWLLEVEASSVEEVLGEIGFAPLPPYIKRPGGGDQSREDIERYQTVFAQQAGAVAAPTAGLHFTPELLQRLSDKGVITAEVTLHVGAGTFKPVTAEKLEDHHIHSERYEVGEKAAETINAVRENGGRVVAVGTTAVRTLETVGRSGNAEPGSGDTQLFITPGFEFKLVDMMITNFHLPKSTLLALVGAFAGLDNVMAAYRHAVQQEYRFYSYGDAMLIY